MHVTRLPRRRRIGRRTQLALLAVIVAVAALSVSLVFSHPAGNAARLDLIHRAPDVALKAQRFQMTMTISLVPQQGPVHFTTESGQLDAAHGRASLLLSDVVSPVPGGLRVVSQGNVLYLLLSSVQAQFPGKRWVAVTLDSAAAAQGAAIGPIPDPLSFLAGLRGVEGTVARVGSASVDGTPTTAYKATIDLTAMLRAVGADGSAHVQALQRLGESVLPVEVWLDSTGRPRQLQVRADLGAQGVIDVEVKFGDFGRPLIIGIPSPDVAVNAPTLAAALSIAGIRPS